MRQRPNCLLILLYLYMLQMLAGCAGFFTNTVGSTTTSGATSSSSSSDSFAYIANANDGDAGSIAEYKLASGTLTALSASPLSLAYSPTVLAVNPADDLLLVGSLTSGGIYAYKVGSAGALTELNSGGKVADVSPVAFDIDASGDYLVVLLSDYTTVECYSITTSTGALTLVSTATVSAGSGGGAVRILPDEDFVYVATGTGGVTVLTFDDSTGAIASDSLYLAGSSTASYLKIAVDTDSEYFAAAHAGTVNGVDEHTIDDGELESGTIYTSGGTPSDVVFGPSTEAVYVSNRDADTIAQFSFSSGTLTALATPTVSTGKTPVALVLDSSDTYLVCLNEGGDPAVDVYGFSSSVTGELVKESSVTSTGTDPVAIALTH